MDAKNSGGNVLLPFLHLSHLVEFLQVHLTPSCLGAAVLFQEQLLSMDTVWMFDDHKNDIRKTDKIGRASKMPRHGVTTGFRLLGRPRWSKKTLLLVLLLEDRLGPVDETLFFWWNNGSCIIYYNYT